MCLIITANAAAIHAQAKQHGPFKYTHAAPAPLADRGAQPTRIAAPGFGDPRAAGLPGPGGQARGGGSGSGGSGSGGAVDRSRGGGVGAGPGGLGRDTRMKKKTRVK
ncbi:unnamed protein product [Pipistrellus nathusii]|uniref:Uncharacterized protein n=1 Tax=Pipistrellus nathusii TaxID=59473 RepID=A0ABN9ZXX8_PIPNA